MHNYPTVLKLFASNYERKACKNLKNKKMLGFWKEAPLEIKLH